MGADRSGSWINRLALRLAPRLVQDLLILTLCLGYIMNNIWAARTVFSFAVLPLGWLLLYRLRDISALRSPIFLLAAAYLGALALSAIAGQATPAPMIGKHIYHSLLILSFIAITATLMARDSDFQTTLVVFMSVSAAISALMNILHFYSDFSLQGLLGQRLQGVPGITVYYNSNYVGFLYAIPCVAALTTAAKGGPRSRVLLLAVAAMMLLLAVVLTQSRESLLAVGAGFAVMLIFAAPVHLRLVLGTVAALIIAAAWLSTPLSTQLFARGDSSRLSLWPVYLDLATQRPIFGYGLAFDIRIALPQETIYSAHNVILNAQIRGGLLAALTLTALIITALCQAWRSRRVNPLALALVAASLTAASVDFEVYAGAFGGDWIYFWLPIATAAGASIRRNTAAMPVIHESTLRTARVSVGQVPRDVAS